jgi:hypothetical protein
MPARRVALKKIIVIHTCANVLEYCIIRSAERRSRRSSRVSLGHLLICGVIAGFVILEIVWCFRFCILHLN